MDSFSTYDTTPTFFALLSMTYDATKILDTWTSDVYSASNYNLVIKYSAAASNNLQFFYLNQN